MEIIELGMVSLVFGFFGLVVVACVASSMRPWHRRRIWKSIERRNWR